MKQKRNPQSGEQENNCPTAEEKESLTYKVKRFAKENRKQIIWLAVTAVVTWFVLQIISNWTVFVQGFNEGLNQ